MFSSRCTGGEETVLQNSLPWHLTYEAFAGVLPNISKLFYLFAGTSIALRFNEITCLMRSEAAHNLSFGATIGAGGTITSLEAGANEIPLTGGFPCEAANASILPSPSTVTQANSSSSLVSRLI